MVLSSEGKRRKSGRTSYFHTSIRHTKSPLIAQRAVFVRFYLLELFTLPVGYLVEACALATLSLTSVTEILNDWIHTNLILAIR